MACCCEGNTPKSPKQRAQTYEQVPEIPSGNYAQHGYDSSHSLERYPERGERYSERGEHYPERGERYPERGERYPERGERYSERGERYPERDERYHERGERYPERGVPYPIRGGNPRTKPAQRDQWI